MDANCTILLVEDTEDDVFLMKRALKMAGIINPLQVVEDGEQAIDYLEGKGAFHDRTKFPFPETIFLDLKLPKKSGFEVLDWLKNRADLTSPKIFVMSSSNAPQDLEHVMQLGAVHYIVKPPAPGVFNKLAELFSCRWLFDSSDNHV